MSENAYQKPKGTADIFPADQFKWQIIKDAANDIFKKQYNFGEISTPLFENFELYERTSGETSDVVQKEMYDFFDKGDRHLALRPEGTAGVVRAYIENKLFGPEFEKPVNLFYFGSMYRYERPQNGRMREFHQLGVESFGSESVYLDAQTIQMAIDFFVKTGINRKNLSVKINSLGDKDSRNEYREILVDYLSNHKNELSLDSQNRLENNPLRILDSKDSNDKQIIENAPSILDSLNTDSRDRFEKLKLLLAENGIDFVVDSNLVRGLDYYSHTIFEIIDNSGKLGSASTIAGGGRYDSMVEELGGPKTPAIGFAIGIERLISMFNEKVYSNQVDVYIVQTDQNNTDFVIKLAHKLRTDFDFSVDFDFNNRSVKSQFKSADRLNAKNTIIIGQDEIESGTISIKDMNSGEQKQVNFDDLNSSDFGEN